MSILKYCDATIKFIIGAEHHKIPHLKSVELYFNRQCTKAQHIGEAWGILHAGAGSTELQVRLCGYYSTSRAHQILKHSALYGELMVYELELGVGDFIRGQFLITKYEIQIDAAGFQLLDFMLSSSGKVIYETQA